MRLSPRLEAILSLLDGDVLADIGADHAHLPIAACLRGKVNRAVACDINPGPLSRAAINIRAYNLEDKIETRLGDGLRPLTPGEADILVLSGMGGMKMMGILGDSPETARRAGQLILQPQHDLVKLRAFLHTACFDVYDEREIREGGRIYTILTARPREKPKLEFV